MPGGKKGGSGCSLDSSGNKQRNPKMKDPFHVCKGHLQILFLLPKNISSGCSSHRPEHFSTPTPTPKFLHPLHHSAGSGSTQVSSDFTNSI